jgi:hypothetical protein
MVVFFDIFCILILLAFVRWLEGK